MITASGIFAQHIEKRDAKTKKIKDEINKLRRTKTAAIAAAGYAKGEDDQAAVDRYLKTADDADQEIKRLQDDLEKVNTPFPIEAGAAAWEEKIRPLLARLAGMMAEYEEDREEMAEQLRQILNLHDHILFERGKYAKACGNPKKDAWNNILEHFPVFTIKEDRVLADIALYKHTGDFTAEDAAYYTDQIKYQH